jgi:hypothetical protein
MGIMGVGIALFYLGACLLVGKLAPDDALLIAMLVAFSLPFYFVGRWMMGKGQRIARAISLIHEASTRKT